MVQTLQELQQWYCDRAARLVQGLSGYAVLKLDAWNESGQFVNGYQTLPVLSAFKDAALVECIEYDERIATMARAQGFAVKTGDIRQAEYPEETFDIIFDPSTTSYFPLRFELFEKFARWLKTDGVLFTCPWLKEGTRTHSEEGWNSGTIHHHVPERFVSALEPCFEILDVEEAFCHSGSTITAFTCRKKRP